MDYAAQIAEAKEKFGKLLEEQLKRVEEMKAQGDFLDYAALPTIKIGVCGGDGIGPADTTGVRTLRASPVQHRAPRRPRRLHRVS